MLAKTAHMSYLAMGATRNCIRNQKSFLPGKSEALGLIQPLLKLHFESSNMHEELIRS